MNEEMMKEWFDEETVIDSATMKEFDEYVLQYLKIREEVDALETTLSLLNKNKKKMEEKLTSYLEAQGKSSHITPMGKIICVTKNMWKAPEGPERESIVEYLKEHDSYEAVTAFNANKFHAWFSEEKFNNPEFDLPGVAQSSTKYVQFRKG